MEAPSEYLVKSRVAEKVEVFLRLRPLNQYELSKRSRMAVEVVDHQHLAVDHPTQGDWEVELDGVRRYFNETQADLLT